MKSLFKMWRDVDEADPIAVQLRAEAGAGDPAVPAGLRRRVISALAAAEPAPRTRALDWWPAGIAAGIVAGVIVAIVLIHQPGKTPSIGHGTIAKKLHPSNEKGASPTPFALAQQWIDDPLEGELRNLMNDLSRTTDTVTNVLPSGSKRKAAIEPPGNGA